MQCYDQLDSPVGVITLTHHNQGLTGLFFEGPTAKSVQRHCDQLCTDELDEAKRQLREYFSGQRQFFRLPMDLHNASLFQAKVYHDLSNTIFGYFRTYEEFAALFGYGEAGPLVVKACFQNHFPIIVPDHRLTMAHQLGPYSGGQWRKTWLQHHERAVLGWRPETYE